MIVELTKGSAYRKKGEFDRALADYSKAIQINPKYDNAYNGRGWTYGKMGELERAIADYTRAIELDPKADRYDERGVVYRHKEERCR